MELVRGIQTLNKTYAHPVVTIGNFDGVHLGHQTIIRLAVEKARARGGTAIAYTFRPHPQVALRPEANVPLLSTYDEKLELLAAVGLDVTIEEPFSREFSTSTPEQFFNDVMMRRLNAEEIVVGYDFAFGKGRQGHLDTLATWCKNAGVALTVVPAQRVQNEVVSSSRIRQHLASGEVEQANRLLGRDFFYRGVVFKGDGRGRQIGFPTANVKPELNKLVVPLGVYATCAVVDGKEYPSVANIGIRPTFAAAGDNTPPVTIEVHLFDQTIDLYGSSLEVRLVKWIRPEMKFSGADKIAQLTKQIALDCAEARRALA